MTYTDKIKASKKVFNAITAMKDDESIMVYYGIGFEGSRNEYKIHAYSGIADKMSYSIWNNVHGMNIDTLSKTTAKAYTFDMMSQRTSYAFPLYEMELMDTPAK